MRKIGTRIPGMARYMLVATMKNEGPQVAEWVAHHRAIGFTDIVVFQNGSTDLTDRALKSLAAAGVLQYFPNDFRPGHPKPPYQNRALRRASRLPQYAECDWCVHLDGDEFLYIKTPEGTVQSLVDAVQKDAGEVDAIYLNWCIFGSSFLEQFDDRLMTEKYTWCEDPNAITSVLSGYKTLFRTRAFQRPGIHRPKGPLIENPVFANASGLREPDFIVHRHRSSDPKLRKYAQVNHYMVRDKESFLLKAARGSASNVTRTIDKAYWNRYNRNHAQDTALAQQADTTKARMAELDALTAGRLLGIRRRSLRKSQLEIQELRKQPDFETLLNLLPTGAPPP